MAADLGQRVGVDGVRRGISQTVWTVPDNFCCYSYSLSSPQELRGNRVC